jgi:hypothetical protein
LKYQITFQEVLERDEWLNQFYLQVAVHWRFNVEVSIIKLYILYIVIISLSLSLSLSPSLLHNFTAPPRVTFNPPSVDRVYKAELERRFSLSCSFDQNVHPFPNTFGVSRLNGK